MRETRRSLVLRRLQQLRDFAETMGLFIEMPPGREARLRLDTPYTGGDGRFRNDRNETDVAGAAYMRATAKFDRKERIGARAAWWRQCVAHRDDADLLAVFL